MEYARKIAATYPILIKAAKLIVQTFNETMNRWMPNGKSIV